MVIVHFVGKQNTLFPCFFGNIQCWRQKCPRAFYQSVLLPFEISIYILVLSQWLHVAFSSWPSPSLLPSLPCGLLSSCFVHQPHLLLISLPPPPALLLLGFHFHSRPFVCSSSLSSSSSSAPIFISKASPLLLLISLRV